MTLKRVAITFNGSLPNRDLVAAMDRTFVRELQTLLLDKEGFDAFYRLDDECKIKDVRTDVICLPPTLQSLEQVVQDIKKRFGSEPNVSVFTFVNGHGAASHEIPAQNGHISGGAFANLLDRLPASFSRYTHLHQCYGGGFVAFGLVDANDLLVAYAGKNELNWTDVLGVPVVEGVEWDTNNDGVRAMQESFWVAQRSIYAGTLTPMRRRFVFLRGTDFVDRGFGTSAAPPPFPLTVTEVQDVMHYLDLTKSGAEQGVTIIGFEGVQDGEDLRKNLEIAAARSGGSTQFLWVPRRLAQVVARDKDLDRAGGKSYFKVFYYGSDASKTFSYRRNIWNLLQNLYRGEDLGNEYL